METFGWLVFALIFGGFGVYFLFFNTKGFIKTDAVITGIKVRRNGKHKTGTVSVKYTVDGMEYNSSFEGYSSGYHKGKTLTILYDPKDPNNIDSGSKLAAVISLIVGILGIAAFIYKLIG